MRGPWDRRVVADRVAFVLIVVATGGVLVLLGLVTAVALALMGC